MKLSCRNLLDSGRVCNVDCFIAVYVADISLVSVEDADFSAVLLNERRVLNIDSSVKVYVADNAVSLAVRNNHREIGGRGLRESGLALEVLYHAVVNDVACLAFVLHTDVDHIHVHGSAAGTDDVKGEGDEILLGLVVHEAELGEVALDGTLGLFLNHRVVRHIRHRVIEGGLESQLGGVVGQLPLRAEQLVVGGKGECQGDLRGILESSSCGREVVGGGVDGDGAAAAAVGELGVGFVGEIREAGLAADLLL